MNREQRKGSWNSLDIKRDISCIIEDISFYSEEHFYIIVNISPNFTVISEVFHLQSLVVDEILAVIGDGNFLESDLSGMDNHLIDRVKSIREVETVHMEVSTNSWVEDLH